MSFTPNDNNQNAEQASGGNGGQRPSFASLWTPNLRRATLLTFGDIHKITHQYTNQ